MFNFITSLSKTPESEGFDQATGARVIILTGQSNAAGRAPNASATPSELSVQTHVKIWSKTNSQFESLQVGNNNLPAQSGDHGLELGLAQNFQTYFPGETLYLIKWAVSSTEIAQHLEGGAVYEELWDNYVVAGINDLIDDGKIPYVHVALWQGERDANTNISSPGGEYTLHAGRFDTWVSLWKSNFSSNIPLMVCEIKEPAPSGYESTTINTNFNNKAATENYLGVMATKSLSDIGDSLHFDYAAQKTASALILGFMQNNLGHRQALKISENVSSGTLTSVVIT